MKKLAVFLLTILVIAVVSIPFTSCGDPEELEKPVVPVDPGEGVYKPGKKIAKVYEQEEGEPERLIQEWTWNGNEVASIDYYDFESEIEGVDEYLYEGGRVVKVRDNWGYYAEYSYLNKQFDKIKYYGPTNILLLEFIFQYDGKNVSTITVRDYYGDKKVISMIERGFMGKLLSDGGMKMVAKKLSNQSKEDIVLTLSYEGENLSLITMGVESIAFSDYDSYSNIWYKFHPFSAYEENFEFRALSKNNPGKSTYNVESNTSITTYTYTYDGNFPVTIQSNTVHGNFNYVLTTRIVYQ